MALTTEPCRWFIGAIQLLGYVNRFPVGPLADFTDVEYLDYRKWIGDAGFIGDLDLRPRIFEAIVVGMGAFHEEQWANTLTLSYLKFCLSCAGNDGFDGHYPIERWIRTNRVSCLQDPLIAQWVECAIGCIEFSWITEDSRHEYAELRRLITRSRS